MLKIRKHAGKRSTQEGSAETQHSLKNDRTPNEG
jgi:hypothetical protein